MKKSSQYLACLLLILVVVAPTVEVLAAFPPLAAGTFPVGTLVVPMDNKQADRIRVYGFIHEFLRLTPNSGVARVIEPPDVSMQTSLTPSGTLYQGGPFLIEARFQTQVNNLLATTFPTVTVTTLTASFTSNKVFFVRQPTTILVIRGFWARSDLYTLDLMGINYTVVDPSAVEADPSIINHYSLIVVDDPGWYGTPNAYSDPANILAVYDTIRTHVEAGNEVIYTDIAIKDLNATFPGYVNLAPSETGSWNSTVYNPAKGDSFQPEFPSQYYNSGTSPNVVRVFTELSGWVVTSVQPAHANDVRILMDSSQYGVPYHYAILGFYFQLGNGIVEGISLHSQQNLYPIASDEKGFYAVREIYGNKFVHGPQLDFILAATPALQSVAQGAATSYSVTVTSVGSFSSPVSLSVSGLPAGASAGFSSALVTPAEGGVAASTLNVQTSLGTPIGSYNLTITASSTLPQITHSTNVMLTVTAAPADFTIHVTPAFPTPLIVNPGQCGNISVTVTSIGNFSAPVNLTLSNRPNQVTSQYTQNPIQPSPGGTVGSVLSVCVGSNAPPGNYTMVVSGTSLTSSPITHTANVLLRVPTPTGPNPLIYIIFLILLLIALAIALLVVALLMRRKRPAVVVPVAAPVIVRPRSQMRYVLPLPTVRCRNCGRIIPLHSVYCPYCGRPMMVAPAPAMGVRVARPGRRAGLGFMLTLISGILILLNAALLLSPSFFASWSTVFWWLPILGPSYAFALGLIIGLVIIMGSIVMLMSNAALANIIILPFAVFSLIIGGGFIAGMILGALGAIYATLRR